MWGTCREPVGVFGEFRDKAFDDWVKLVTDLGSERLSILYRRIVLAPSDPVADLVRHLVEHRVDPTRYAVRLGRPTDAGCGSEKFGVFVPLRSAK